ncbi:hypothetical protein ACJX0J_038686, partial [Zea mays]
FALLLRNSYLLLYLFFCLGFLDYNIDPHLSNVLANFTCAFIFLIAFHIIQLWMILSDFLLFVGTFHACMGYTSFLNYIIVNTTIYTTIYKNLMRQFASKLVL